MPNHLTMQAAAKQLNYGRNKLFNLLRKQGVLSANNQPKQRWVREGYFKTEMRQRVNALNQYQPYYVTLVTIAGLNLLRQLINEETATDTEAKQRATSESTSSEQRETAPSLRRRDRRSAIPGATPRRAGTGTGSLPRLGAQPGDSVLPAQSLAAAGRSGQRPATSSMTRNHS